MIKIPKDPKIIELNIGHEIEDGILVSEYELNLLHDLGFNYPKKELIRYELFKELYFKGYNPKVVNDYYFTITKQKYLRHPLKPEYTIAFDWNIEKHMKVAISLKTKLLIYDNQKFYIVINHIL